MNARDPNRLMHRLLDGETLEAEAFSALENELLENPHARREWQKLASLHSALHVHHEAQQTVAGAQKIVPVDRILARQRKRIVRISLVAAAALVMLSALGMWFVYAPSTETAVAGVRVIEGSEFVLTHADSDSQVMELTRGSRVELHHGAAELTLPHDVRAIVQAPASATLLDERTLQLDHGRAYFEVPSADGQGFTVATPHQRIVDLGTAFGIDAPPGSQVIELHVINGHVRVDPPDGSKPGDKYHAPRAVALQGTTVVRELEADGRRFLRSLPEKVEPLFFDDFASGLLPATTYAVRIDPRVILDAQGHAFPGIEESQSWKFRTGLPAAIELRNSSFEADGRRIGRGDSIAHWESITAREWGWGVDEERDHLRPSHGDYFGRLFDGNAIAQSLDVPITAGTTYVLTLDMASRDGGTPVVGFFGSDRSHRLPLAESFFDATHDNWTHRRTLRFTATEADATGQTLGIVLRATNGTAAFDHLRLQAFGPNRHAADSAAIQSVGSPPDRRESSTTPVLLARHPADGAIDSDPNQALTMSFDRPIQFGSGRIIIEDRRRDSEHTIVAATPRLSISESVLQIQPSSTRTPGLTHLGLLPGWELDTPAGIHHPEEDAFDSITEKRRHQHMARVLTGAPHAGIRRQLGAIEPDHHYTASLTLWNPEPTRFPGCRIRFLCGDTVIAEHVCQTPPGPANRIESIGLSWDSSDLPAGMAHGDPLVLEIAAAQTTTAGTLFLDAVRVTAVSAAK